MTGTLKDEGDAGGESSPHFFMRLYYHRDGRQIGRIMR